MDSAIWLEKRTIDIQDILNNCYVEGDNGRYVLKVNKINFSLHKIIIVSKLVLDFIKNIKKDQDSKELNYLANRFKEILDTCECAFVDDKDFYKESTSDGWFGHSILQRLHGIIKPTKNFIEVYMIADDEKEKRSKLNEEILKAKKEIESQKNEINNSKEVVAFK